MQRQIAPAALLRQRCLHRPAKRLVAVASQTLGEFAQAVEQLRRKRSVPAASPWIDKISALLLHIVAQDAPHTGVKGIIQTDDGYPLQPLTQLQRH